MTDHHRHHLPAQHQRELARLDAREEQLERELADLREGRREYLNRNNLNKERK